MEYQTEENGLRWKLIAFSGNGASLDSAARYFTEVLVSPYGKKDTLYYEYDQLLVEGNDPLREFLKTRFVGDSLEMITFLKDTLNAGFPYGDTLVYRMRIDRMRTPRQLEDRRMSELAQIDALVRTDSVAHEYREVSGGYFRTLQLGDTAKPVEEGREIVIHYQGRTLNGEVFDDSRRMAAPLRFVFGNEGQVLRGLDIALSQMHLNETAEVILPSWLAFGAAGSADGRVPPYTTVVYRVEVVEMAKY